METLKALVLFVGGGGVVFGLTLGIQRVSRAFQKKSKKSCCD